MGSFGREDDSPKAPVDSRSYPSGGYRGARGNARAEDSQATLNDGRDVAIKKLDTSNRPDNEFLTQVSGMASRGANPNGRRSTGSLSDEEEPDEREDEDEEMVRIPTLRSTIVRMHSDEDEDRPESPPAASYQSPLLHPHAEEKYRPHSYSQHKENWRRLDSLQNNSQSEGAFSQKDEQRDRSNARGSEDRGGNHHHRAGALERRERDRDVGRGSRDRGDRVGGPRVRDSDRDKVGRRELHSRNNSFRRDDRHRDEGGYRRESGRRRGDIDRSIVEGEEKLGRNDEKGKAKRGSSESPVGRGGGSQAQQRGWRQRDGGSHGQNNHLVADNNNNNNSSRRNRDDLSPSSADSRDLPDVGTRVPPGGAQNDYRRMERERGDGRDEGRGGGRRDLVRGRDGDAAVPDLYSIHKATVHSVRPFGVFVRLDGYRNHGLVHLSQISEHEVTKRSDSEAAKVEAISSVVGEGEQVWVKVVSVKTEDDGNVKVGCSLKYVSQGDGKDLDPNNLQLEKLQSKPAWQAPKKLELEAIYNVVCTRCGGHGHLKKECYSSGDKTYELLQDEDAAPGNGTGNSKVLRTATSGAVPKNLAPTSTVGPSSKPPSGPAGRGRSMVQPAWMKHGVGVGGDQEKVLLGKKAVPDPGPEKVTTVQEALAVLGKLKEEKRKRRDDRRHRKLGRRDKKHGTREGRREKHKKRHRSEDEHPKSRKKHRV